MSSLYLRHRPTDWDEIKGNEALVSTLSKMLEDKEKCPHVFLLSGPSGCGKTTIGRIIATKLGCHESDFNEIDSADFRGVDTIRDLRSLIQYKPSKGDCRVWLLDEVHKLTNDAQSAALKMFEDTPSHVYFILCTTDPQKLLPTIIGRCSQFQVSLLSEDDMRLLLRQTSRKEGIKLEKEVIDQIIQDAQGHARNALNTLDQVLLAEPEQRINIAIKYAEEQSQTIELCRILLTKGTPWKKVANVLAGLRDQDPEGIRRAVLGYCQAILLKTDNDQAGLVMECFIENLYSSGFPGLVYACYRVIKN
jgi:DNA polymerase-3 subunit gamma/tau